MAQMFVLTGLCEYYTIRKQPLIKKLAGQQIRFIEDTFANGQGNGYVDGFTEHWSPEDTRVYSFATHFHYAEALHRYTRLFNDKETGQRLKTILHFIPDKLIDPGKPEIFHQTDQNGRPLPNEIWIGHHLEFSWVYYEICKTTGDKPLIDKARGIFSFLCEDALQKGMDGEHGGIFNRYDGDQLISDEKDWWPQAEGVLALLKLYSYTRNKKYLNHATRLIDYIEHTFSDPVHGEWHSTVSKEGTPFNDRLKTNFWKSLYHNVRYCIEAANELKLHYS